MASPFPGVDPYLEAHWRDVHTKLIVLMCLELEGLLPSSLRVRVEHRVVMASSTQQEDRHPDVSVVERRADMYRTTEGIAAIADEPLILEAEPESVTEPFLEISDKRDAHRVVTVLEVLSLTNKTLGADRDAYIEKQRAICRSETNLVEIDLLRGGKHTVAVTPEHIPEARRAPYLVCVRRATTKRKAEVYPISINAQLPRIRIPLRQTDEDVVLPLQPLLDRCSQGYDGDIDYNLDPVPPFAKAEAEWADKLLREKGVRTTPQPKSKPARKKASR